MIDIVKGIAILKEENSVTIMVGGIGLLINVSSRENKEIRLNEEITLFTKMVVREDDISIYGFISKRERSIFSLLTMVSGIGPKVAMGIMGMYGEEELRKYILSSDVKSLTKAPGVGKKTAERIILELKDRIVKIFGDFIPDVKESVPLENDDAIEALVGLGFSAIEVKNALMNVDPSLSVDDKIKIALKNIGR
ncbi:Holliday junction DNA helicase RuvA [Peptoniphilus duerdenii ATCC BAA-1640]|uniref:Holliday junction branch migration complex subunit RuvA n=1 Tax=Peptoniphilus duerdenii ATCC BAA-1640 TaxID=862517 RepID=E0NMS8_9FIRM|nr:Holliday junction branch migration protein RuvA [Peptoniphilus duerdenii]EFM24896.1 Holliday junction DNA helicase RuvA [Peptoniphilus duerdenii ATCC BAA-1640]